jgi:hypothetical protein
VLPATLGWALLLGAALGRASTTPRGWLTGALVTLTLLESVATDAALATGAYKQHWRALAADTAVAAQLGGPIVTYPTVAGTLLGLYQPRLRPPRTLPIADGGRLPPATLHHGRIWLAYPAGTGEAGLIAALQAHSYVRLLHLYYPYPLYLDLYARPGTPLGSPLPAVPWHLVRGGALLEDATGDNPPLLGDAQEREEIAYADRPAAAGRLYEVVTTGRAAPGGGAGAVFLECLDGQAFVRVAPDGAGAVMPADGAAHSLRVAVLCPAGTTAIRVDLRAEGHGPVRFRVTRLVLVVPPSGARSRS